MRRANGFAMTEALVAIGIGALIMTAMIYLQVDFIGWTKRAAALGRPDPSDQGLQASLRGADRCAGPGRVLAIEDTGGLGLKGEADSIPFLGLPDGARADIVTARRPDGSERPGWSAATIARDDTAIAVAALRCDLPEVCAYDPQRGDCGKR
ncbi:prepilin-type N-terminal cleavage/methylation domain-containing protein [Caulobacter sp. NIBR1757]|uniref:type IV pilus modification PilV family protein n=1 Tax=Caulobacter sp. NIBR1757 TaxID=3016000 RepID=UPI0022F0ECFE|nr:prepilin-type N-terminal cleavage/methylation domain-containing protein [Caulobacter sp. NIBR1757]WGM40227.1 hypothetical protein AMEJIAPC_03168 [Caulobacter sp. NIBR1757]